MRDKTSPLIVLPFFVSFLFNDKQPILFKSATYCLNEPPEEIRHMNALHITSLPKRYQWMN